MLLSVYFACFDSFLVICLLCYFKVVVSVSSAQQQWHLCVFRSGELAKALQDTENLLGEISVMTRKKAPAVGQCAEVLSAMEAVVTDEVASVSR